MLLCGRDIVALRQILDHLCARPAARKDARFGEREAPFQVRHGASVGALLAEAIRVLEVELVICATYVVSAGLMERAPWSSTRDNRPPAAVVVSGLALFEAVL
jgi:hypothetical protein